MNVILLIGAPASGKGTYTQNIQHGEGIKWEAVSTGNIFRSMMYGESELSKHITQLMEANQYIDDETTCSIVKEYIQSRKDLDYLYLDGFPRSLSQFEFLEELASELDFTIQEILNFNCPKEDLKRRVDLRLTCKDCSKVTCKSGIKKQSCEHCGGELFKRYDDNIESFEKRYNIFMEQTQPIIKHLLGKPYRIVFVH